MMMTKKSGVFLMAMAFMVLLCAASCARGGNAGNAVSGSDSLLGDDGKTFCRGVWVADNGSERMGYYIFTDKANGTYLSAEDGMGVGFTVDYDGMKCIFHMGAADVNETAEVLIPDLGKRTMTWESDGRMEFLALAAEHNPDTFTFYSAQELGEKALDYYEQKEGSRPEHVGYTVDIYGVVTIQLYDSVDGHNSTAAYYEVDGITGKGKDLNTNEGVDLSK